MADPFIQSLRAVAVREDCWSDGASLTLTEARGRRYVELNRGNLRQKDWQEVCDVVNARHGNSRKSFRNDVQCKNRIDSIKKKYKVEKARVDKAGSGSLWCFFDRLDELIGHSGSKMPPATAGGVYVAESVSRSLPMALPLPYRRLEPFAMAVLPKKRPLDDSNLRRSFSVVAAAAAAGRADDDYSDEEEDVEEGGVDGIRELARAIKKFGGVYEKVEAEKQNQMIEMEKQRMLLVKDLEVQRMQMFVNMQLQLNKFKTDKRNKSSAESA